VRGTVRTMAAAAMAAARVAAARVAAARGAAAWRSASHTPLLRRSVVQRTYSYRGC
jgi:hypothetical protein